MPLAVVDEGFATGDAGEEGVLGELGGDVAGFPGWAVLFVCFL